MKKGCKDYLIIFLKCMLFLGLGLAAGLIFYYFFRHESVIFIEKFKFLQSVFGIREYSGGMTFTYVFLTIFLGNMVSTAGYFALGLSQKSSLLHIFNLSVSATVRNTFRFKLPA